ncbi:tRNA (guanine-N(7)-)-methyltransferase non-catalytic subunit trm82 [Arachnomyces sp. PD_36]|nr:tRNA (guanine-N(7)-)-methyltransferase non-catalytic subunit trm82 [Arachnomyces sp. PD_36]
MSFQHPFQAIQYLAPQESGGRDLLFAAAGPSIYAFDLEDGAHLSIWPQDRDVEAPKSEPTNASPKDVTEPETQGPPEKKRKLSSSAADSKPDDSQEAAAEDSGSGNTTWSVIPILTTSADGKHLIAVTGEDKCIRVFNCDKDGKLTQLSGRCMPKRPCAVIVTPDNSTILCGDKFGDVYELPLFPAEEISLPQRQRKQSSKPFQPTATKLTVHTKRNLEALEQQLKATNMASERSTPAFNHKLLLGHVSLLTDVAFATIPAEKSPSGKPRSYVLTSDRDEHIRVSRGSPQTHIIEGYCFGHTEFVSKLCIPPSRQDILISGGGDSFLLVWDWREGKILQQVQLGPVLDSQELAVRGIWTLPLDQSTTAVMVACDGIPSLFCFSFGLDGVLTPCPPIQLSGNVLDVTCLRDSTIIVSIDNLHEPSSTKTTRTKPESPQTLLQAFKLTMGKEALDSVPVLGPTTTSISSQGTGDFFSLSEDEKSKADKRKALGDLLYGIENLRKRRGGEE